MFPLEVIEITTGPNPQYSVIWLHGLGADGNDFVSVVPELHLPIDTRFIFPSAPMRPITCNQGHIMRGWYDIVHFDGINREVDVAGVNESIQHVRDLIAKENERGIPSHHIILAGFSQGGAIAYMAGLTHFQTLAGVLALSTYIPLIDALKTQYHRANHNTPVFIGHGTIDPIVPFALASTAKAVIEKLGNPCEFHAYTMQHSLCLEEIQDIGQWVNQLTLHPKYSETNIT